MHYTNEQIEEKNSWLFFYYDNKDFFFCLCEPMESTKIRPSRILIILQCIASVLWPEVLCKSKKQTNLKNKKFTNTIISNLRYMYEQTKSGSIFHFDFKNNSDILDDRTPVHLLELKCWITHASWK